MPILILEGLLLIAMIVIAISIILGRKLLSAAVIYCAFSLAAMILYTIAGAADVAFTEAIIGTISTVYFIIAIKSIRESSLAKKAQAEDVLSETEEESCDGRKVDDGSLFLFSHMRKNMLYHTDRSEEICLKLLSYFFKRTFFYGTM